MKNQDYIHAYTRADAIADGQLVDVSSMAREANIIFPTAVTAAVWADINAIPERYNYQSVDGRLWDVVWMLYCNIRRRPGSFDVLHYHLIMHTENATHYHLKAIAGPGDDGEPVITIMRPDED